MAQVPVKIPEGDLLSRGNGLLNGVYVVIDAFVHVFDPARYRHLPAEEPALVLAAQGAELADQGSGFFLGQKAGGLDRVHQEL